MLITVAVQAVLAVLAAVTFVRLLRAGDREVAGEEQTLGD